jgi:hypothetical protein
MTIRELFEAEFPVPEGLTRYFDLYVRTISRANPATIKLCIEYNAKWIGFQAGYKAGKENNNA